MVRSSRRTLFLVVFVLVTCGFFGMVFGQKINPAAAPGGDSDVRDSLHQFTQVYSIIEQNYAEPVNADKAIYNGAIPGMLHVLDPHSNFFDPKAYSLLREAMSQDGRVGIAKVSFRDKEHLAALRFKGDAFVLETMYWPDEIRDADFGGVDVHGDVRGQELEMARQLIDSLTGDWNPEEYTDEYRQALLELVEKKVAGEEIEIIEAPEPIKVVDLMEALKASVEAAKKPAAPAKASTAKRTTAKKSTAKRSTAKRKAG